jgi:hypothetical protein
MVVIIHQKRKVYMDLDRPQSAARTISIVAVGLLSLGLDLWLVRR